MITMLVRPAAKQLGVAISVQAGRRRSMRMVKGDGGIHWAINGR